MMPNFKDRTEEKMNGDMDALLGHVETLFGVTKDELIGDEQKMDYIYPRHIISYIADEMGLGSLSAIGRYMGRNHASIMNGRKKVREWLTYDKKLRGDINAIKIMMYGSDSALLLKSLLREIPVDRLDEFIEHVSRFPKIQDD